MTLRADGISFGFAECAVQLFLRREADRLSDLRPVGNAFWFTARRVSSVGMREALTVQVACFRQHVHGLHGLHRRLHRAHRVSGSIGLSNFHLTLLPLLHFRFRFQVARRPRVPVWKDRYVRDTRTVVATVIVLCATLWSDARQHNGFHRCSSILNDRTTIFIVLR